MKRLLDVQAQAFRFDWRAAFAGFGRHRDASASCYCRRRRRGSLFGRSRQFGRLHSATGPDDVVQTLCLTADGDSGAPASILGTPAYWAATHTIYVAAADDTLKAFPLTNGRIELAFMSSACIPKFALDRDIQPLRRLAGDLVERLQQAASSGHSTPADMPERQAHPRPRFCTLTMPQI